MPPPPAALPTEWRSGFSGVPHGPWEVLPRSTPGPASEESRTFSPYSVSQSGLGFHQGGRECHPFLDLNPHAPAPSYGKLYATYASLDFDPNLPPAAATTTNCLPATANVLGVA